jgi:hypothetical protein
LIALTLLTAHASAPMIWWTHIDFLISGGEFDPTRWQAAFAV